MTKELRLIPEALNAGAQRYAALADASATARAQTRHHWSRLDAGWQSYARDNADAYFGETVRALERDEAMLRQMSAALLRALRRIDAGDAAAARLFEVGASTGAGGGGATAPGAPDISLDPLAGLAPALGAPFLGEPRTGAPFPVSSPAPAAPLPPPGVKISGIERTVVPEVCGIDGHCNAVTAQLSASFKPTLQPVSIVFGTDGAARGVELSLGKLGSVPLGTLQLGASGFEYSFAALAAQVVSYTLAGGATVSVLAEPIFGSKPVNGQPASYVGEKFSIVVSDPATGITSKGSVALRIYSYDKPKTDPKPVPARPAPQPPPQFPLPNPGNGGPQQPLPMPPVIVPGLAG